MSEQKKRNSEVTIIGSGPAGLTAAIYTARANLNPIVIEGNDAGGQLMTTTEVENFPGFPEGISGPELIDNMKKQAKKFGTQFISGDVTDVDFKQRPFVIKTAEEEIRSQAVIIATGATARYLNIDSVQRLKGRGISACATCDGFFFRDKKVFVIGGGDSAMEEANFLTKFASEVTIVHRRDQLRASQYMQDLAGNNPKIKIIYSHTLKEVLGDEKVTGVILQDLKNNAETTLDCDGIFFAIGHDPATEVFKQFLETKENGYLKTVPGKSETAVEGVFSAGDVDDDYYRQAITAAGEGCRAALEAERWLSSHK